ncbi:MAG: hypothetical protein IPK13_17920 [Deltaproteobacteria bacterium]|nr:hypothetical protein [Deltaproteobacteria bacterium]
MKQWLPPERRPGFRHSWRGVIGLHVLLLSLAVGGSWAWAVEVRAEAAPGASEIAVARAAFEYRDFAKVVELLTPLLNPTKIPDRSLEVEARLLQGVSLFLLNRTEDATREFEQILRLDPKHKLDPFAIPPSVIAAFEAVREQMHDVLNTVLAERGETPLGVPARPNVDPPTIQTIVLPSRALVFLPGGAPQFLMEEPEWGSVYLGTQIAGLAANILGFALGQPHCLAREPVVSCTPQSGAARTRALAVQYIGLSVLVTSWVTSTIHGWLTFDEYVAHIEPTTGT